MKQSTKITDKQMSTQDDLVDSMIDKKNENDALARIGSMVNINKRLDDHLKEFYMVQNQVEEIQEQQFSFVNMKLYNMITHTEMQDALDQQATKFKNEFESDMRSYIIAQLKDISIRMKEVETHSSNAVNSCVNKTDYYKDTLTLQSHFRQYEDLALANQTVFSNLNKESMVVTQTQFGQFKRKYEDFVREINEKLEEFIDSDSESIGNSISGSEPNRGLETLDTQIQIVESVPPYTQKESRDKPKPIRKESRMRHLLQEVQIQAPKDEVKLNDNVQIIETNLIPKLMNTLNVNNTIEAPQVKELYESSFLLPQQKESQRIQSPRQSPEYLKLEVIEQKHLQTQISDIGSTKAKSNSSKPVIQSASIRLKDAGQTFSKTMQLEKRIQPEPESSVQTSQYVVLREDDSIEESHLQKPDPLISKLVSKSKKGPSQFHNDRKAIPMAHQLHEAEPIMKVKFKSKNGLTREDALKPCVRTSNQNDIQSVLTKSSRDPSAGANFSVRSKSSHLKGTVKEYKKRMAILEERTENLENSMTFINKNKEWLQEMEPHAQQLISIAQLFKKEQGFITQFMFKADFEFRNDLFKHDQQVAVKALNRDLNALMKKFKNTSNIVNRLDTQQNELSTLKINNAIKIAAQETDKVIQLQINSVKAMIDNISKPMDRKVIDMVAETQAMARQNENFMNLYRKLEYKQSQNAKQEPNWKIQQKRKLKEAEQDEDYTQNLHKVNVNLCVPNKEFKIKSDLHKSFDMGQPQIKLTSAMRHNSVVNQTNTFNSHKTSIMGNNEIEYKRPRTRQLQNGNRIQFATMQTSPSNNTINLRKNNSVHFDQSRVLEISQQKKKRQQKFSTGRNSAMKRWSSCEGESSQKNYKVSQINTTTTVASLMLNNDL